MKIEVPSCLAMSIDDRRWFVLLVRGGMEDQVFADLKGKGYETYLPRRRYDQNNRRNRVWVERNVPLFPGHLFIVHPRKGGTIDNWSEVTAVIGVKGVIGDSNGPLKIPGRIIEQILTDEFAAVYDETAAGKRARGESDRAVLEGRFPIGGKFKVDDGPFAGFMAEVEELTHQDRVKALVAIFGRFTTVEFETWQLTEQTPKSSKAAPS